MKSLIVKYSFLGYALITIGQLWLYLLNLSTEDLYERVNLYTNNWIGSHVVLMLGALLILPATLVVKRYCVIKWKYLVHAATGLTILGALSLIAQYAVDFYLVGEFKGQNSETAYKAFNKILSYGVIRFVCYDLISVWLVGQILFVIALFKVPIYPKWALGLFMFGLALVVFGSSMHDLLERLSYLLISIALWPIFNKRIQVQ